MDGDNPFPHPEFPTVSLSSLVLLLWSTSLPVSSLLPTSCQLPGAAYWSAFDPPIVLVLLHFHLT